jgi:PST family polysaccharide transporter
MNASRTRKQWDFGTHSSGGGLKRASVRGGFVTLGSQVCKFLLQGGSLFILGRMLSPAAFGLVAMVQAVLTFAQMLRDMGLSAATIQRPEITHEQVNTLFWVNVALGIGLMSVSACSAPAIAWFFKEPRLTGIVVGSSLSFLASGLGVQHSALLSRQMRFKALAIADCGSMFLSVVSAILCVMAGMGYWSLVVMQVVLAAGNSAICWIMCSWRPSAPALHPEALPMIKFGRELTGFSFLNYFARNIDNVLIGRVWGPVQLGFYAKAYQILLLPLTQLNGPMQSVALPMLSRLTGEPERYRMAYLRVIRLLNFAAMPLVGFMFVTADWLIPVILGPKWGAAVPMYRWLALAGVLQPLASSTGWLFMSQGRSADMFRWAFISTGLIVASIVGALHWGATAVSASYGITCTFIVCPTLFWFVTRTGPVRMDDFYEGMSLPGGVTLAGAIIFELLRLMVGYANPYLAVAVSAVVWPAILCLLLVILPSGREALREMIDLVRTNLPASVTRRGASTVVLA